MCQSGSGHRPARPQSLRLHKSAHEKLCTWTISSEEQQNLGPYIKHKYNPGELFFQPFHHFLFRRCHPLTTAMTFLSHHLASDRWFLFRKSGRRPQSTTTLLTGTARKVWQRRGKKKRKHPHTRLYIGLRPTAEQFWRRGSWLPSVRASKWHACAQRSRRRK